MWIKFWGSLRFWSLFHVTPSYFINFWSQHPLLWDSDLKFEGNLHTWRAWDAFDWHVNIPWSLHEHRGLLCEHCLWSKPSWNPLEIEEWWRSLLERPSKAIWHKLIIFSLALRAPLILGPHVSYVLYIWLWHFQFYFFVRILLEVGILYYFTPPYARYKKKWYFIVKEVLSPPI